MLRLNVYLKNIKKFLITFLEFGFASIIFLKQENLGHV